MTYLEFWKSIERTKTKLEMTQKLNDFCRNKIRSFWGYLGLIRWNEVQNLVNTWINEIGEEQIKRMKETKKEEFRKLHSVK